MCNGCGFACCATDFLGRPYDEGCGCDCMDPACGWAEEQEDAEREAEVGA